MVIDGKMGRVQGGKRGRVMERKGEGFGWEKGRVKDGKRERIKGGKSGSVMVGRGRVILGKVGGLW